MDAGRLRNGRSGGRDHRLVVLVEDADAAADGDAVVAVLADVVGHDVAMQKAPVGEHRSHSVLLDVDHKSLVRDPGRNPTTLVQYAHVHRRHHL